MFPPIYALANASAAVKALLGTNPLRVYAFGEAQAKGTQFFALPYCVWQSITINPENRLGEVPGEDFMIAQVDVYAETISSARATAKALRDLYQQHGYISSMREWPRETETNLFRYQLDVDFIQYR